MATTEYSEHVAHFPVAGRFRRIEWDRAIGSIAQFPAFRVDHARRGGISPLLKRPLDIAISVGGIVVFALPMLLVALLIKLESSGPVLYRSERLGFKGRRIRCTKFRTMAAAAAHRHRDGKVAGGEGITRLGRFLRRHSIDEIPQLFDVLRGDMSIVGPKPPAASEMGACKLPALRRLAVMPGITGLWQLQGVQDPGFGSYISPDVTYIENWSPWLDLKIIAITIAAAVDGIGS